MIDAFGALGISPFRVPLFVWPAIGIVLIALAAVVCAPSRDEVWIAVPRADLPAFHRLTAKDLVAVERRGADLADGPHTQAQLVGRVTRQALPADERIPEDAVTRALTAGQFDPLVPLAFETEASLVDGVGEGDWVRFLFAPATTVALPPVETCGLLVDVEEQEGEPTRFLVGVRRDSRTRILSLVARSDLLVVPASG